MCRRGRNGKAGCKCSRDQRKTCEHDEFPDQDWLCADPGPPPAPGRAATSASQDRAQKAPARSGSGRSSQPAAKDGMAGRIGRCIEGRAAETGDRTAETSLDAQHDRGRPALCHGRASLCAFGFWRTFVRTARAGGQRPDRRGIGSNRGQNGRNRQTTQHHQQKKKAQRSGHPSTNATGTVATHKCMNRGQCRHTAASAG